MPKLKLHKSAKFQHESSTIVDKIICEIKAIPCFASLKLNQELTKSVCCLLEDYVATLSKKNREKIDKSVVVLDIIERAYSLLPEEVDVIKSQIAFLVENGMIKPTDILSKLSNFFSKTEV
jgi:hypothetical protein